MHKQNEDIIFYRVLPCIGYFIITFLLYAYHQKKNTETPVKILILKQIHAETSEPSLEALEFQQPPPFPGQECQVFIHVMITCSLLSHLAVASTAPEGTDFSNSRPYKRSL